MPALITHSQTVGRLHAVEHSVKQPRRCSMAFSVLIINKIGRRESPWSSLCSGSWIQIFSASAPEDNLRWRVIYLIQHNRMSSLLFVRISGPFVHHKGTYTLRTMSHAPSSNAPVTANDSEMAVFLVLTLSSDTLHVPSMLAQRTSRSCQTDKQRVCGQRFHVLCHPLTTFVTTNPSSNLMFG
jgi:hypothetical protein